MTADEKRDSIARQYITRLEGLYQKALNPKPGRWTTTQPLLNLATQIAAELRRAKASLVTAKEQRKLIAEEAQMDKERTRVGVGKGSVGGGTKCATESEVLGSGMDENPYDEIEE